MHFAVSVFYINGCLKTDSFTYINIRTLPVRREFYFNKFSIRASAFPLSFEIQRTTQPAPV